MGEGISGVDILTGCGCCGSRPHPPGNFQRGDDVYEKSCLHRFAHSSPCFEELVICWVIIVWTALALMIWLQIRNSRDH